jgi:hypothetical protein
MAWLTSFCLRRLLVAQGNAYVAAANILVGCIEPIKVDIGQVLPSLLRDHLDARIEGSWAI